jgi:hypothetical protein
MGEIIQECSEVKWLWWGCEGYISVVKWNEGKVMVKCGRIRTWHYIFHYSYCLVCSILIFLLILIYLIEVVIVFVVVINHICIVFILCSVRDFEAWCLYTWHWFQLVSLQWALNISVGSPPVMKSVPGVWTSSVLGLSLFVMCYTVYNLNIWPKQTGGLPPSDRPRNLCEILQTMALYMLIGCLFTC